MRLTMSTVELVQLVIDEIWNRGELEMADEFFSQDYVNHGGLIPDLLRGPEAIKLSVALYRSAFPDFQIVVDEVTAEEEAIVLRWVARCAPPVMDVAAAAKDLKGITRCRIEEGKIAESWTVWDSRAAIVRLARAKRSVTARSMKDAGTTESRSGKTNGGTRGG